MVAGGGLHSQEWTCAPYRKQPYLARHARYSETGTYWIYVQLLGCSVQLKIDDEPAGNSAGLFQHGDFIQPVEDSVLPTTDTLDDVRRAVHLVKGSHSLVLTEQGDGSGRPVQIGLNGMQSAARFRLRHAGTMDLWACGLVNSKAESRL